MKPIIRKYLIIQDMNHNIFAFTFLFVFISLISVGQEKIPLNHTVYDSWNNLNDFQISDNGKWIFFQQDPQKGDGFIVLKNIETDYIDTIPRAYSAKFSPNSDFLVFKIKPQQDTIRKMKFDKIKKDKLPKDTLGILVFGSDTILKFERVKSFRTFKDSSSWLVYHKEKKAIKKKDKKPVADESVKKKKAKKKSKKQLEQEKIAKEISDKKKAFNKKQKGTKLVIYNPVTGAKHSYNNIQEYDISRTGKLISFIRVRKDTLDTSYVFVFNTQLEQLDTIFQQQGIAKKVCANNTGSSVSFICSQDTSEQKTYSLYFWENNTFRTELIVDTLTNDIPKDWSVSEHGSIYFSRDDSKLYFGTALKPKIEPEDSLIEEEKYHLDVWHWKDPYLQPQQVKNIKKEQNRSYTAVYHIKEKKIIQIGDTVIRNISIHNKGNTDYAIGISRLPYAHMGQWDMPFYKDFYLIDINTGEKQKIAEKIQHSVHLSTGDKYLFWFDLDKQEWLLKGIDMPDTISLTGNLDVNFYNEERDVPQKPGSYGIISWTKNDKYLLIYDMFDIWKIDPTMQEKPYNLTKGYGRENNIKFKNIWLDNDAYYLEKDQKLLLSAFYETDKKSGFYSTTVDAKENPNLLIAENCFFRRPIKARYADRLIWRKETFKMYPNISYSNIDFTDINTISDANPQQTDYLWGNVEPVSWKAYDGQELDGLLYKPENFDAEKKYPMIVYFYEKYSDNIYRHYRPAPSRSVINFAYYTSNDYIVFIPDINYGTGHPGKDAYNAIVSGTDYIADMGFVDKAKIGIQGQSWGGYQVAFLVTQTNKYAAAMAGALVSNMTSAYGGIRWGSGMSRQFQYEKGQSRIGESLWENRDLYIENSPLFFADKVNTPLLIMHNDNDGAVPWYQGIEYFTALRRLQKPVWMLTYNNEEHNLRKRPNCVDLSIRMSQFFDHYLKDAPAPKWLKNGLPAVDKGKKDGYGL